MESAERNRTSIVALDVFPGISSSQSSGLHHTPPIDAVRRFRCFVLRIQVRR